MSTGWSWNEVEHELTADRLQALQRYWLRSPPGHILLRGLAMWVGSFKPPPDKTVQRSAADLQAVFPNGLNSQNFG